MIENGYARFVRVYVNSWHKKASLRMAVVTSRCSSLRNKSFRCAEGCDFDVCVRCAEMSRLRGEVCRAISSSNLSFQSNKIKQGIVDFSIFASTSSSLSRHLTLNDNADRIAESMKTLGIVRNDDTSCRFALSMSPSCTERIPALRVRDFSSLFVRVFHTPTLTQVLKYMTNDINPQSSFLSHVTYFSSLASSSNEYTDDGVNRKAELLSPFQILAKTRDIVQIRSLRQTSDNTCGYYALYNASCVLRCLRDLKKKKKKNKRYHVLSNLLRMYVVFECEAREL